MRRFSHLHSIPVRIMGGFAAMLLLLIAVAAAVWHANNKVEATVVAEVTAEAKVTQMRAASIALGDTQRYLSDYLRTNAASDHDALQAAVADFVGAVTPLIIADSAVATLGEVGAELRRGLAGVVDAANNRRNAAADLLAIVKQAQNALGALAAMASHTPDRTMVEAISTAVAAALRPFSAVAIYLASEGPADEAKIQAGTAELNMALQAVLTSGAEPPARLQRLVGTVAAQLDGLEPAVEALKLSIAQRGMTLTVLDGSVVHIRTAMLTIRKRIEGERRLRHQEMLEARDMVRLTLTCAVAFGCVLGGGFGALVGLSITRPVRRLADMMHRLAEGTLDIVVPDIMRRDEIGGMAAAVQVFKENMIKARNDALVMEELTQKLDLARLHQLVDVSFEGIVIHQEGTILYVNEALCALLGYPKCDLIDHDIMTFLAPAHVNWRQISQETGSTQTITGEVELLDFQGHAIPAEIHSRRIDYIGTPAIAMAVRDLTARRRSEASLVHMARHDPLTGLPNRLLMHERLSQAIDLISRNHANLAVLFLDLDRFKAVNDQLGHAAGDELLIQVAQRLGSILRLTDTVARLGGDEFAIVLTLADTAEPTAVLGDRILKSLSRPFVVTAKQVTIGASIGVAFYPADGDDVPALLRSADSAMYRAKTEGRNTFRYYDCAMDEQAQSRHSLAHDLRQAIDRQDLELHYQPLVCCRSGEVVGFEALARWNHQERGYVSPNDFIKIAEETSLIDRLGLWALETACAEAASWRNRLQVAVNLSPLQFRQHDLPEQIRAILARTGLAPDRLNVEVTEGVLIDNPEQALKLLSEIKAQGISISIDDFGTGFSSLSYLQRFPFDKIKIDRSFVQGLGQVAESTAIVRAIIALGQSLRLVVIAEGVETRQQADILRSEKCSQLQGYLLGRPMPARALAELVGVRHAMMIEQVA